MTLIIVVFSVLEARMVESVPGQAPPSTPQPHSKYSFHPGRGGWVVGTSLWPGLGGRLEACERELGGETRDP